MENIQFNVIELTREEKISVNGGGPGWLWLGKVVGTVGNFISDAYEAWATTPEGAAVQQALRDFQ